MQKAHKTNLVDLKHFDIKENVDLKYPQVKIIESKNSIISEVPRVIERDTSFNFKFVLDKTEAIDSAPVNSGLVTPKLSSHKSEEVLRPTKISSRIKSKT